MAAPAPARDHRPRPAFEDAAIPMSVVAVHGAMMVVVPISRSRVQPSRLVRVRPLPSAVIAVVMVAMMVPPGMHVPGLTMASAVVPLAVVVHWALMHPSVMATLYVVTAVEASQHRAGADRKQAVGPILERRTDQSADDAAHQRAFQRWRMIGPSGCRRHCRGERDGSRERDPTDNEPSPALFHRDPPFPIAGLRAAPSPIEVIRQAVDVMVRGREFPINKQTA